jgi:hypothetical protein
MRLGRRGPWPWPPTEDPEERAFGPQTDTIGNQRPDRRENNRDHHQDRRPSVDAGQQNSRAHPGQQDNARLRLLLEAKSVRFGPPAYAGERSEHGVDDQIGASGDQQDEIGKDQSDRDPARVQVVVVGGASH